MFRTLLNYIFNIDVTCRQEAKLLFISSVTWLMLFALLRWTGLGGREERSSKLL